MAWTRSACPGALSLPHDKAESTAGQPSLERTTIRTIADGVHALRFPDATVGQRQAWPVLMGRTSHDLRTPLNAVIGFADLMRSEIHGPVGHPRYAEYLEHIADSAAALLKSAEDTLALAALLTAPERSLDETIDLDGLVAAAWEQRAPSDDCRRMTLESSGLEGIEVRASKRGLRQILANLIGEAISRAASGATIRVAALAGPEYVRLEILVSGMRPAPRLPDPSLAICLARAILDLEGADLVESEEGDAWRVSTLLPRAAQDDLFTFSHDMGMRQDA